VDLKTETEGKPGRFGFSKLLRGLVNQRMLQQGRWLTFLFFVAVSAGFWLVRSLSEEYEAEVTYPVRYVNLPEHKVLADTLPTRLRLRVKAKGFSIMKSKLNLNLIPLKFNVSSFSLNSIGTDTFFVVTESIKPLLSSELFPMRILKVTPDTLFFRFTHMTAKKVAIRPILALHEKFFKQQYTVNGSLLVQPDSIIISGPEILLNKISSIQTEMIQSSNLDDTVMVEVRLKLMDKIASSHQKVQVTIPVDRFTEVEQSLSVVPVNVPDSLTMIAIPGRVSMACHICLNHYNQLQKKPPVPHIDYNELQDKPITRLTVFLSDTPGIISNVRFNPKATEFLITRK
jgi:hypothetical protein